MMKWGVPSFSSCVQGIPRPHCRRGRRSPSPRAACACRRESPARCRSPRCAAPHSSRPVARRCAAESWRLGISEVAGSERREERPMARRVIAPRAASSRRSAIRRTIDRPRPSPWAWQRPFRQALELLEDRSLMGLGDANAGIPYLHDDADAAPTRTDEHAARARIFDRVRQQILQQATQEQPVRARDRARPYDAQLQAFCLGKRTEFAFELAQQLVELQRHDFGPHGARVESGDVEKLGDDALRRPRATRPRGSQVSAAPAARGRSARAEA